VARPKQNLDAAPGKRRKAGRPRGHALRAPTPAELRRQAPMPPPPVATSLFLEPITRDMLMKRR